ncbi:MAG: SLC13 family permease [Verrucomicrobiota bacterium]|jgi:GntP family gluconate:H+ symporter|nr:SLC13 family permease [Verrucomicrobiota bacterium]
MEPFLAASQPVNYSPFCLLAAGVAFVLFSIIKLRLHPFLGLTLGAILVGLLIPLQTPSGPGLDDEQKALLKELRSKYDTDGNGVFGAKEQMDFTLTDQSKLAKAKLQYNGRPRLQVNGVLPDHFNDDQAKLLKKLRKKYDMDGDGVFNAQEQKTIIETDANATRNLAKENLQPNGRQNSLVKAISAAMVGFGVLVGKIGFVIAMAAIIGMCMLESGAADMIVRRLMATLGEARASWAMLLSGFILSIPVFFDTVFFLLIPLARALALRTGKNYTLYVCAICAGGAITHTIVPPTPGPLIIVENFNQASINEVDAGKAIIAGLLVAILPVLVAMWYSRRLNTTVNVPLRETRGSSIEELEAIVKKDDKELPSFGLSIMPVVLPVVLISSVTFLGLFQAGFGLEMPVDLVTGLQFVGDKNQAMLLGAILAMYTLAKQRGWTLAKMGEGMSAPLETAGVIILITGAGGAFGNMIKLTDIRGTIEALGGGVGGGDGLMATIVLLLIAWVLTAVIRAAQGSATVSMITGSSIMAPIVYSMMESGDLYCHPIYFCLAIGFGAFPLSWMNDSGFWVVQRMSGFTEKETLQTWTKLLTVIGVVGLVQVLVFASLPFTAFKPEKTKLESAPAKTSQVSSVPALASPGNLLLPPRQQR